MADFVKKGPMGTYTKVQGGYSDINCTHAILTKEEYDEMCETIASDQKKIEEIPSISNNSNLIL